jgi:hypothetical protein
MITHILVRTAGLQSGPNGELLVLDNMPIPAIYRILGELQTRHIDHDQWIPEYHDNLYPIGCALFLQQAIKEYNREMKGNIVINYYRAADLFSYERTFPSVPPIAKPNITITVALHPDLMCVGFDIMLQNHGAH